MRDGFGAAIGGRVLIGLLPGKQHLEGLHLLDFFRRHPKILPHALLMHFVAVRLEQPRPTSPAFDDRPHRPDFRQPCLGARTKRRDESPGSPAAIRTWPSKRRVG
jgi:hypothetical protein